MLEQDEALIDILWYKQPVPSNHHGTACSRMLLMQPPIHEPDVRVSCCCRWEPVRIPPGPRVTRRGWSLLESPTGISMGQVWDTVTRLRAEHALCPNPIDPFEHDDRDLVRPLIVMQGRPVLRRDDPLMMRKRRYLEHIDEYERRWHQWSVRMTRYMEAKHEGEMQRIDVHSECLS